MNALAEHPPDLLDVTSPVDVTLAGYPGSARRSQAPANIATNQDNSGSQSECAGYFVWGAGIGARKAWPNHLWRPSSATRVVVRAAIVPRNDGRGPGSAVAIANLIQIEP